MLLRQTWDLDFLMIINWVFKDFNLKKQGFSAHKASPWTQIILQTRKGMRKADFSKFSRELSSKESDRSWHRPKLNSRQLTFNKNIWSYQRISTASPDFKAQWEWRAVCPGTDTANLPGNEPAGHYLGEKMWPLHAVPQLLVSKITAKLRTKP